MKHLKFIIKGGNIPSRNDADVHYISAKRVAELYGIPPYQWEEASRQTKSLTGYYIKLRPNFLGEYNLAETVHDQINTRIVPEAIMDFKSVARNSSIWERIKFIFTGKL